MEQRVAFLRALGLLLRSDWGLAELCGTPGAAGCMLLSAKLVFIESAKCVLMSISKKLLYPPLN